MMERETQTPPPPPMVSYCSFSQRGDARPVENRELEITVFTSTWFTWLLAPLSSFCNTHTVSLASSLRASASPGAAERPLPALPQPPRWQGAAPGPLRRGAAPVRKRGTRREESAIISLIVLFSADSCCFLLL